MKKIIYWYGVYSLCVAINGILRDIVKEGERSYKEKTRNTNENCGKESGHLDDTDWKPMNKIGFQISAE